MKLIKADWIKQLLNQAGNGEIKLRKLIMNAE